MSDPMAALAGLSPREQRVLLERLLRQRATQPRRSPLSASQQRLWFLDQLDPGSTAYNIPAAVRMEGTLDSPALRASLDEVVRRHETLRTTFALDGDEPVQIVSPSLRLALPTIDLRRLPPPLRLRELRRLAREEALAPFDLARGPLLRATLVLVGNREHVALLSMHHIICDGWSMGVLVREIASLYDAFVRGLPSPLPALPIQYSDYARWQRRWLLGEEVATQLAYWQERLAGELPVLSLPTDRPRPPLPSGRGAIRNLTLPAELVAALRRVGERRRSTLFMTLLAAFETLLHRYTGQDDILVGSPIANRRQSEVEGLIGMFVNALALRTDLSGNPTFSVLLERVREMAVGAYAHQDVPFERLVNALRPERRASHQPIFQVLFVLQNVPMHHIELPGLTFNPFELDVRAEVLDLTLTLVERGSALAGYLTFNADLFEEATVARLLGHFATLLHGVATEPDRPISTLPLLTAAERRELLDSDAATVGIAVCLPEVLAHELFERQAEQTPGEVAVLFADERLTYRELEERGNRLARYLRGLGVGCDSRVGLCLERSVDMLVSVLGVLKAGAAYVPLDPTYPRERLSYMLETAAVTALVTQEGLLPALPAGTFPIVVVDRDRKRIEAQDAGRLERLAVPESLAYVIFTSGSTGRPKGVAMVQGALTNLILWQLACPGFEGPATTLQFASLSFDASFHEIFTTLARGGTLVLISESTRRDPHALVALLAERQVERLFVPFVVLQQLAETAVSTGLLPRGLRRVVSAGEQLRITPTLISLVAALPRFELYNEYGPSESHVVTAFRMSGAATGWPALPPIGKPLPGTWVLALDRDLELAPIGVPAEIYIGGVALARGYLGRPDLTAERFVPDPYAAEPGGRLYRTGDLARRLANGDFQFLRRIDDQVKVRGFRIELGEVEAVLARHPGVRQTVAAVSELGGARRLVAYVVADPARPPQVAELRVYLQRELPDYMIPAVFVWLRELPLLPSGKVDRRALPAPGAERPELSSTFAAPCTPVEERLAAVWAEVLAVERVGVTDNFFELGGDSILSIQLVARARRHGLRFSPDQLFQNPTIAKLAGVATIQPVEQGEPRPRPVIAAGGPLAELAPELAGRLLNTYPNAVDAYPLSPMQQGILVHVLTTQSPSDYSQQFSTVIRGRFDAEAFTDAWKTAVACHPVLRTCFVWEDLDEPLQVVLRDVELPIAHYDLRGFEALEQRQRMSRYVRREQGEREFDLDRAPLLRIALFALADDLHEFVWSCHELVLDGWSGPHLLKEVHELYEALARGERPEPAAAPAYRSYIEWLGRQDLSPAESFWRRELAGFDTPTVLGEVRAAGAATARPEYRLEVVGLGDAASAGLRALAREAQVTLNTVAQGAWALVLARHGGGSDVVFGGVASGRSADLPEVESMLGLLLNTLPVRVEIPSDAPVGEWLQGIQSRQLTARRFEFSPLARIQRWSEVPPGQRLFQSVLDFHNYPQDSGGSWTIRDWSEQKTGYPVFLLIRPGERLALDLTYDCRYLSGHAARRLLGHFKTALEVLAAGPRRLSAVEVLTVAERAQLLTEWNDTAAPLPARCFLDLFTACAAVNSGAVAALCGGERLTYGELDRRTDRLARALIEAGVEPESVVALLDERGLDFLTAVLATFKAGAAYLPLDPRLPAPRVLQVLESSGAAVLLAGNGAPAPLLKVIASWASGRGSRCLTLAAALEGNGEESGMALPPSPVPGQLAYVIYTSGSTGIPKGAMVTHAGMLNHLLAKIAELGLTDADTVAQNASQGFDISVWQLLAALVVGGRVHVVPDELAHDPGRLLAALQASEITILEIVPSLLHLLLEEAEHGWTARRGLGAVRAVIATGEALSPKLCRRWFATFPSIPLLNAYGPTECSDDVAHCRFDGPPALDAVHVPIGRPLPNTHLHVLDRHLCPRPAEVPGELCVGGMGVGRGYLNDPGRTASVVLPDPFGEPGARMYRTGDLARFLADGRIEFLGRIDHQVKIRGFRIELGEIEAVLGSHPEIREAVVLALERPGGVPGDRRLVAYVAVRSKPGPTAAELRAFVGRSLPEYMVPAAVVVLDALPLTANGKIDRRALPKLDEGPSEAGAIAVPHNPTEEMLASIWAELLGRERVGVDGHFFELGGHSLLATQVVSRVRRAFGVELPLRRLFEVPTVKELAVQIEALRQDGAAMAPPLEPVPRGLPLPLSFAQQRMWLTSRFSGDGAALNSGVPLRLVGALDHGVLQRVLRELVHRHEGLRTRFPLIDGEPAQVIEPAGEVALPVVDLRNLDELYRQREAQRWTAAEFGRPFDLTRGPLFRVLVLWLSEQEQLVLPTMHHIVTDEWSTRLLVEELTVLYAAFLRGGPSPLPEARLQYADFAVWQRRWLSGAVLEAELEHWRRRLWAPVPPVELSADGPNPTAPSTRGAMHTVHLDGELGDRLRALARQENATLFMAALAVFKALLFRRTGQTDLVVVTDVANRTRPGTERLLGFFANVVALRTTISGNLSFRKLLGQVREVALEAYSHQELPFDELVRRLRLEGGPGARRPFNVYFSLQSDVGVDVGSASLAGVAVNLLERTGHEALRDLSLMVQERSGALSLTWLYKADLLRAGTVEQMGRNFATLLRSLVNEPEACLQDLELLTESEKKEQAMEQQRRERETLSRFKRVQPKAVSVSEVNLVKTYLLPGTDLPLVIEPSLPDVDLYDWAASSRTWLEQELSVRGALLFRGFGVRSAAAFERFCSAVARELYGDYGDLPRESEGDKIYGSTPYPPDKTILFHNESSHTPRWPMKQFFCCIQASVSGGETPLVDCRKVYQRLDPEVRERFERLGLLYLRNFTEGLDVSWREFFRTNQRSEVEHKCRESGIDYEWVGEDDLRIGQRAPAVVRHPKTGEKVFFNQVQLHHSSCLDPELRASLTALFEADRLPRDVRYGDGTPIEDEVIAEITRLYWELAVSAAWREGDVVMLDNVLVAHARKPYEGPRKILVAMAEMMEASEVCPRDEAPTGMSGK